MDHIDYMYILTPSFSSEVRLNCRVCRTTCRKGISKLKAGKNSWVLKPTVVQQTQNFKTCFCHIYWNFMLQGVDWILCFLLNMSWFFWTLPVLLQRWCSTSNLTPREIKKGQSPEYILKSSKNTIFNEPCIRIFILELENLQTDLTTIHVMYIWKLEVFEKLFVMSISLNKKIYIIMFQYAHFKMIICCI